jgi:hypothetical protein
VSKKIIYIVIPFLILANLAQIYVFKDEYSQWVVYFSSEKAASLMVLLCLTAWIEDKTGKIICYLLNVIYTFELISELVAYKIKGLTLGDFSFSVLCALAIVLLVALIINKWVERFF